jgi:hypothetical protein
MFDVNDQIDVVDLTDVKKESMVLPPSKNVKVRIVKTEKSPRVLTNENTEKGKKGDIKSLGLSLEIADGIPTTNVETGEETLKFKGMKLNTGIMDLIVWADLEVSNKKGVKRLDNKWWKNKQHLVGLKQFCVALDIPLAGLKVTDAFLSELIGRELLIDIGQEEETVENPQTGEYVKTGTMKNRIQAFKKVS